jgi:hypothetical protein
MITGVCRLCCKKRDLLDSHVLPSFAHKEYVADQAKGGVFGDLSQLKFHSKHNTQPLFCEECDNGRISPHESKAAKWLREIAKIPSAQAAYEGWLLPFVVSLSLRSALYYQIAKPGANTSVINPAIRQWRQLLLEERSDVLPYSQHAFIAFDQENGLHNGLGNWIDPEKGFLITQVGPLWSAALLSRKGLTLKDIRTWERSIVLGSGGTLDPISEKNVYDLTPVPILQFFRRREKSLLAKMEAMVQQEEYRTNGKPRWKAT